MVEQRIWKAKHPDNVALNKEKAIAKRRLRRQQAALQKQQLASQQRLQEAETHRLRPKKSVHLISQMTPKELSSMLAVGSRRPVFAANEIQQSNEVASAARLILNTRNSTQ